MSKETPIVSGRDGTTTLWRSSGDRGVVGDSSSSNNKQQRGIMMSSESLQQPKTAKIMPINPPQNWTSPSTANLESNGVSVTIVSSADGNKPPAIVKDSGTDSVTITPANPPMSKSTTATITTAAGTTTTTANPNVGANGLNSRKTTVEKKSNNSGSKPLAKDVSMDPSFKDGGMAKCEHCGKLGVKHAFYTKKRNFCSNQCVRAASKSADSSEPTKFSSGGSGHMKMDSVPMDFENEDSSRGSSIIEGNRSTSSASNSYSDPEVIPVKRNKTDIDQSYDWTKMLNESTFVAANVSSFKHAPVSYLWENVTEGMKVEVENTDVDNLNYQTAFWVASVIKIQGYKVLLRFEGFEDDSSRDFWVNLCSQDVHHVGWCATKQKPLIPPRSISGKFADWRDFLVKRLTGARTLPQNFQKKVESGKTSKYELGAQLEVVDKNRICQLRLASVRKIVGKRLHVEYFDTIEDGGFWCHEDSALIHQVGWANTVGHEIVAPKSYNPQPLPRSAFKFPINDYTELKEGSKLEAIDPLNLSAICAATVKKVLKMGYVMIRVDCYEEDPGSAGADWFCYHITSPYIFPCGFAARNKLVLTPPHGYTKENFNWDDYLRKTNTKAVPGTLMKKENLDHEFEVKMRLEAADLMDPRLICVATISQIVGRLLKIHFDGWEEEYDQWLDATSPDIYPVGWSELVGHRLEPPRAPVVVPKSKKPKKKPQKVIKPKVRRSNNTSGQRATKSAPSHDSHVTTSVTSLSRGRENAGFVTTSNTSTSSPRVGSSSIQSAIDRSRTIHAAGVSVDKKKTEDKKDVNLGSPVIPRLSGCPSISEMDEVDPRQWKSEDVKKFLEVNECGSYCEAFSNREIDGPKLLDLTKDQLMALTQMKVGPAVKIFDLISQLKRLVQAARVRNSALSK